MKYYLIAGEASGDLHGSNLMKGLVAEDPKAEFRFWGGGFMEAVGGTKVRDYAATAVMGLNDVLRSLGKISRNLRDCKADILQWKPDVVILIDYPGFNMKIARFCHENGIRVFYYIAPKTWASREGRNRKLKAWVDKLFIVFPFEIPYFTERDIPFIYEGNPLLDAVDNHEYTRPEEGKYIAILAGSRKGEISHTMPNAMAMADALHALPQYADYKFLVAGAPARSEDDYLMTKVVALHRVGSFKELYASLPLEKCGYSKKEAKNADPNDMRKYYTAEDEAKYGVVGIELELDMN